MKHEETIKKIQELVPDIMKLEFGCEVMFKNGWGTNKYTITKELSDDKYKINTLDYGSNLEDMTYGYDFTKILGKPITLAVVMLAIEENENDWFVYELRQNQISVIESWNLSKDDFNEQSEETKDFIGELLK